jgi:hypothetical protein
VKFSSSKNIVIINIETRWQWTTRTPAIRLEPYTYTKAVWEHYKTLRLRISMYVNVVKCDYRVLRTKVTVQAPKERDVDGRERFGRRCRTAQFHWMCMCIKERGRERMHGERKEVRGSGLKQRVEAMFVSRLP